MVKVRRLSCAPTRGDCATTSVGVAGWLTVPGSIGEKVALDRAELSVALDAVALNVALDPVGLNVAPDAPVLNVALPAPPKLVSSTNVGFLRNAVGELMSDGGRSVVAIPVVWN